MSNVDLRKAQPVFASDDRIVGAWVFGSAQTGELRGEADLDVAVLFRSRPNLDTLCELRARLQETLGVEAIDLVVLNDASPLLAFEALCGRRLYSRDDDACAEFASLTARQYEDEKAQCEFHMLARA
ncbi:MAG: nucleotidyltransferase domain-containing protein [Verrucomicrobiia bacterium]|jgi:predicted nucleotidyltransferase